MKKTAILILLALTSYMVNAQTKIIAHRGFSGIAPENSLSAFEKAIEIGAEYFELDIHKTKDDSLVVIHDAAVDRTASENAKGKIAEMTYKELSAVNIGNPSKFGDQFKDEKIITLREALALAKGKIKVCIEIKVYGAEEEVIRTINELGVNDEVIIFSFYYPVLAKIRSLDKNIPILYLISAADATTFDYANVIHANAIGVGSKTNITKEFLAEAHQAGLEVWRWTVDEEEQMKELIGLGIDGLISNFPDKAMKIKKEM
ncbi:glycerophosphodiester phosphodiesterase family protein [Limibacter armeniacum]|uniref:glycerophosphodiester phosphodiesterase n=1 Tax=Limibacter armeniacum TaxID=466084 RepID=UPI002FE628F8